MLAMDWHATGWKDGSVWTDSQVGTAANVDGGYSYKECNERFKNICKMQKKTNKQNIDGGYANPQPKKPSGESIQMSLKAYTYAQN